MPKKGYSHLTPYQRCQIYTLLKRGVSKTEIAKTIKKDRKTITRELNRNKGKRGYRFKQAQKKATARRRRASAAPRKMTPKLKKLIAWLLKEQHWSPEQISGRMKVDHGVEISTGSIYNHINDNRKKGGKLYMGLRRKGKKYVHTLTADNGKEFAYYQKVAKGT